MDFLGNIFLGIRIFDWIVLLLLLTIVSSLSNLYKMMWDTSSKLKNLWEKLYWNEKIEEIQSRYAGYDDSSSSYDSDLDEDESLSKKKDQSKVSEDIDYSKFKQFKSDEGLIPTAVKVIKWIGILIVVSYLIYGFVIQK